MATEAGRDHPRGLGPESGKLWAASPLSNLGDGVALVAAPLLAAALTHDPAQVGGLAFAQRLPWLLFALVSGALADRLDRRRIMVAVGAGRALLIGLLGVAVLLDVVRLPLLYTVFFLFGVGETLFDTAAESVLPDIVSRDELPRANRRLTGTMTVTNQFVGPPLGGVLFAAVAALPFLLGAGGLAAAAALIAALRGTFTVVRLADAPPPDLRAEVAAGIRWLWRHPLLRAVALALALLNITLVAQVSIMVLYARERLGLDPACYGLLVAMYGIGGTLGGAIAHRVLRRLGASRVLRLAIIIEAAVPAVLALTTDALLAGGVLLFFGVHAVVWGVLLASLRQELTPAHLRGRVTSAYRLLEHGGAAPGALIGGPLAALLGLTAPFWLGALTGLLLLPLVWSAFSPTAVAAARRAAADEITGAVT